MNTYDQITNRIIDLLNQGTVPWHKSWKIRTSLPRNLISKKPYRGINVFLLLSMNYESPYWLTFLQVRQLGGSVKPGEKASPVVFWKQMSIEDKESGELQKIALLRLYHVFNIAQCIGIEDEPAEVIVDANTRPAEIVANMPQSPIIKHGMARAYYSPAEDTVGMPSRDRFDSETGYYATLFHELVHSTGHERRLKRPGITERNGFGSNPYAKEELIAEMGAAFLCGHAEIWDRTIENSAAYLHGWITELRQDRTLVVQAAAQAQKAADFILGQGPEDSLAGAPATGTPPPKLEATAV